MKWNRKSFFIIGRNVLHNMFYSIWFNVLSDLSSNPNNLNFIYQCIFSQLIRRLFDVSKYFIYVFKNIKTSIVRINSSQYICRYVHSNQFLMQVYSHENMNQTYNLTHYNVFVFSPWNVIFIFVTIDCSLVKMTWFFLWLIY